MTVVLSTASLADVWRNPGDPRWRAAHETVSSAFRRVARQHPRLSAIPLDTRDDACEDLLAGFWCHLAANPAVLEARRVRTSGALHVECWRFLDRELARQGGRDPSQARQQMLSHLRSKKVVPALKREPRFVRDPVSRLWLLAAWRGANGASEAPPTDDVLISLLPEVPSRLVAQRGDQVPPLVDDDVVPDFLTEALARACRPRAEWALVKLLWARLRPSPEAVFLATDASPSRVRSTEDEPHVEDVWGRAPEATEPETAVARDRWAQRVDVVASQIVDALTPRQQAVAAGRLQQLSNEEMCRRLGVSRGTLHNDLQHFRALCEEAAEADDLDDDGMRVLVDALLNILGAEAFRFPAGDLT